MSKLAWSILIAGTLSGLYLFQEILWPTERNGIVEATLYAPPFKPDSSAPYAKDGEIKQAHTITFALPRAYILGSYGWRLPFGTRHSTRGVQTIMFGYWDKSLDPWSPESDAHRTPCIPSPKNPQPAIDPCPNSPLWARNPTSESFHTLDLFNAVGSPAEHEYRTLQRINQAKRSTMHCAVSEDAELRMTTISLPERDIPANLEKATYNDIPKLCPTEDMPRGLGPSGELARVRQPDGTYRAEFRPKIYYVHLDSDGRPVFAAESPGWIGVRFESWHGRLHGHNINPRDWVAAHDNALKFLKRFKRSSTTD